MEKKNATISIKTPAESATLHLFGIEVAGLPVVLLGINKLEF